MELCKEFDTIEIVITRSKIEYLDNDTTHIKKTRSFIEENIGCFLYCKENQKLNQLCHIRTLR